MSCASISSATTTSSVGTSRSRFHVNASYWILWSLLATKTAVKPSGVIGRLVPQQAFQLMAGEQLVGRTLRFAR